jgi:hypothetical protein
MAGVPTINPVARAQELSALREFLEGRVRNPSPHPITQLMPNLFEMGSTIAGSAYNLADVTKRASQGDMNIDPGPVTEDILNTSVMGAPTALAANRTAGPFYSALKGAVEAAPIQKGTGEQWAGTIRNTPGVKQEELGWTGFNEFLKSKPSVTKQEASDFLEANKVDIQEVVKGDYNAEDVARRIMAGEQPTEQMQQLVGHFDRNPNSGTKFSQYQLPGGENYRELLLTLPRKQMSDREALKLGGFDDAAYDRMAAHNDGTLESTLNHYRKRGSDTFQSSHYDEPNILAHVRFNDRVDASGKKTLFLEEIQSDWHQKGRKEGYVATEQQKMAASDQIKAIRQQQQDLIRGRAPTEEIQKQWDALDAKAAELGKVASGTGRIPDAPFKTSWPELSLKRMIKYAVDNGYDSVSWTPGKVQAERYDLSKQVDSIYAYRKNDGSFALEGETKRGGRVPISESVPKDKLADYVGKELAEKIAAQERMEHTYTGVDLKMGGEGMTAFYDKMLPAAANKLGKKYGAKVGVTALGGKYRLKELGSGRWAIQADGKFLKDAGGAGRSWATKEEAMAELKHQAAIGNASEDVAQEVWSLPITDAMRKEVGEKGVPLFSGGAPAPQPSDEERAKTLQSLMGNQS